MDIEDFERDPQEVEAGQWIGDLPGMGDLRLKVRGLSSPQYRDAFATALRKVPNRLRDREGSPLLEEKVRIAASLMHKVVLLDWDGLCQKGKPVAYDAELAKMWCTEPRYRKFADAVAYAAQIVDNGNTAFADEVLGN